MYGMRISQATQSDAGIVTVRGAAQSTRIGTIREGEIVQWRRPDETIGEATVLGAHTPGELQLIGCAADEFAPGNVLWDR